MGIPCFMPSRRKPSEYVSRKEVVAAVVAAVVARRRRVASGWVWSQGLIRVGTGMDEVVVFVSCGGLGMGVLGGLGMRGLAWCWARACCVLRRGLGVARAAWMGSSTFFTIYMEHGMLEFAAALSSLSLLIAFSNSPLVASNSALLSTPTRSAPARRPSAQSSCRPAP